METDYYSLYDLLLEKWEFYSFTSMINCGIRISSYFNDLHFHGLCHHNFSLNTFWARPDNGDVLVLNDRFVFPENNTCKIASDARYMAPSIVTGGKPKYLTDRFSLAVCLFMLFVRTHPLEGVRTLSVPEMNDYYLQLCYGSDPIFIADPTDRSNGPSKEIDGVRNYFKRWPILSASMQNMFIQAFSKEAMLKNEKLYPSEKDWQRTLLQYRSFFVKCPVCGKETYVEGSRNATCKCCGKQYPVYGAFSVNNYVFPIVKGGGIFSEHIDDFSDSVAQFDPKRISIVRVNSKKGIIALENISDSRWSFKKKDGQFGTVKPGEYVTLSDGMEIKISSTSVSVSLT